MEENKCSVPEAASLLGISPQAVHQHIERKNLRELGRFGKSIILDRQQVERLGRDLGRIRP